MKITNKFNLPKTFMNAVERDDYTMGDARISVTGLLKPPRIGLLFQKHAAKIEKDVTDQIWSILGRAVHKILELGGDEHHLTEERLYAEVRGWRISGQADLQSKVGNRFKIVDYKNTSAYAVMGGKIEWEQQLNCYRYLVQINKLYEIDELEVCAIVRDWSRHKAKQQAGYPEAPVVMVPIRLWSMDEAREFIERRVALHQAAIASCDMGDEPPPCTDEERWMRPTTYAVIKEGNKRPTKMFDDATAAAEFAKTKGDGYRIETRPGEPVRCSGDYCNVSAYCSQYREWREKYGGQDL